MIDKMYGRYILTCDVCGAAAEGTFFEFYEAVDHAKATGWKKRRKDGEWINICPDCCQRG